MIEPGQPPQPKYCYRPSPALQDTCKRKRRSLCPKISPIPQRKCENRGRKKFRQVPTCRYLPPVSHTRTHNGPATSTATSSALVTLKVEEAVSSEANCSFCISMLLFLLPGKHTTSSIATSEAELNGQLLEQ